MLRTTDQQKDVLSNFTEAEPAINLSITQDEELSKLLCSTLVKLYKDPVLAVVREFISNALDANKQAGSTKPIIITTPTYLGEDDLNLVIKDWGAGLSPTQIRDNFMSMGGTSKATSNDPIGGFGIGSKCIYALKWPLTLTTVSGGIKYTWSILDAAYKIAEQAAKEDEVGTTISIIVPREQRDYVRSLAWTIANYYTACYPNTIILDSKLIEVNLDLDLPNCKGISPKNTRSKQSSFLYNDLGGYKVSCIGGIPIAINRGYSSQSSSSEVLDIIKWGRPPQEKNNYYSRRRFGNRDYYNLLSYGEINYRALVVNFEIGPLTVLPSREELETSTHNSKVIELTFTKIKSVVEGILASKELTSDDYWLLSLADEWGKSIRISKGRVNNFYKANEKFCESTLCLISMVITNPDGRRLNTMADLRNMTCMDLINKGYNFYKLSKSTQEVIEKDPSLLNKVSIVSSISKKFGKDFLLGSLLIIEADSLVDKLLTAAIGSLFKEVDISAELAAKSSKKAQSASISSIAAGSSKPNTTVLKEALLSRINYVFKPCETNPSWFLAKGLDTDNLSTIDTYEDYHIISRGDLPIPSNAIFVPAETFLDKNSRPVTVSSSTARSLLFRLRRYLYFSLGFSLEDAAAPIFTINLLNLPVEVKNWLASEYFSAESHCNDIHNMFPFLKMHTEEELFNMPLLEDVVRDIALYTGIYNDKLRDLLRFSKIDYLRSRSNLLQQFYALEKATIATLEMYLEVAHMYSRSWPREVRTSKEDQNKHFRRKIEECSALKDLADYYSPKNYRYDLADAYFYLVRKSSGVPSLDPRDRDALYIYKEINHLLKEAS
jgi:hypothetical protein